METLNKDTILLIFAAAVAIVGAALLAGGIRLHRRHEIIGMSLATVGGMVLLFGGGYYALFKWVITLFELDALISGGLAFAGLALLSIGAMLLRRKRDVAGAAALFIGSAVTWAAALSSQLTAAKYFYIFQSTPAWTGRGIYGVVRDGYETIFLMDGAAAIAGV